MFARVGFFSPPSRLLLKPTKLPGCLQELPLTSDQQSCLSSTLAPSGDREYFQRSIVPTDHFQYSLPRLPIPKLEDTCHRYLTSQEALLTPEELEKTTRLTNEFRDGPGKVMHERLIAFDKENKHTSYISAPWYDYYLKYRDPLVLNHNPFMAFVDDPKPEYNKQAIRSTNMIVSAMRFLKTYRDGLLEPEVFHLNPGKTDTASYRNIIRRVPKFASFYASALMYKAYPLDMSQFPRLFNSTRIPRLEKDELVTDTSARHLVVMRRGHFYVFDVLDKDGNIVDETDILAHIQYILNDNRPPAEYPIGVLTAENRDTWAKVREQLVEAGNSDTLHLVDSAVFALQLDDDEPNSVIQLCKDFLHGDAANRWYDKSFSLIMNKAGKTCVNFEHSWGDGVAVLRFFNEVFKDSTQKPRIHPDTKPSNIDSDSCVTRLDFQLNDGLKSAIKSAQENTRKFVSTLGLNFLEYKRFGKNLIKKEKLSPDSVMQLAMQLAFFKQHGETVATYESCSTAAFKHGRTETIRPATLETNAAVQCFTKDASKEERREAMKKCSIKHGDLTKNAAMGQGFDRHLFAMKYYANLHGETLPDFYHDPAYTKMNHIIMSTSTLSSPAVLIGGFAAVTPNGYGLGYSAEDDRLGCVATCYPPARDVTGYLECLEESFDQIHDTLS